MNKEFRCIKRTVIKSAVAVIVTCILVPAFLFAGQYAYRKLHNEKQIAQSKNPLVEEMVMLDYVFRSQYG